MAVQVLEQEQVSRIGWPFGLQPLNTRLVGETFPWEDPRLLITSSPSFSSSSGLETESTVSFFGDGSVTLGRLIGFPNGRSVRASVRQSRASCNARGIWLPHYKRQKGSSSTSWFKWLFKLRPRQTMEPNRHGDLHARGSLPSLGQLLNLEELQGSSAHIRSLADFVYTGSVVNNAGDCEIASSLDPLGVPFSRERGAQEHESQNKPGIIQLVTRKTTSFTDTKILAKARSCMICCQRNTPE